MSENGRKYLGQKNLTEEQWDRLLGTQVGPPGEDHLIHKWADHIVEMKKKGRKDADGKWLPTEWGLYMQVPGRVGIAQDDHDPANNERLDMEVFLLELDWDRGICTVQVKLTSSLYGIRTGTATSRWDPVDPDRSAEATNPIETAETSAVGRALGFYGYGILPGSGMASAEDMTRPTPPSVKRKPPAKPKGKDLDAKLGKSKRGEIAAQLRTRAAELELPLDAITELMDAYAEEQVMTLRRAREYWVTIDELVEPHQLDEPAVDEPAVDEPAVPEPEGEADVTVEELEF